MRASSKLLVSDASSDGSGKAAEYELKVDAVTLHRGGHLLIEGVSFCVANGGVLWLKGKNGSGKTSLLRAMAGLIPIESGQITLGLEALRSCDLHYVGHQDGLKARATVYENLQFYAALFEAPYLLGKSQRNIEIVQILKDLSLLAKTEAYVTDLSAGQKRRLALARLLIAPRPVWLLDEPLTALDDAGRDYLYKIIEAHSANGGTVIAASHDPLACATKSLTLDNRGANQSVGGR